MLSPLFFIIDWSAAMIENDDMNTLPRPVENETADAPSVSDVSAAPATIQVPAIQEPPAVAAPVGGTGVH